MCAATLESARRPNCDHVTPANRSAVATRHATVRNRIGSSLLLWPRLETTLAIRRRPNVHSSAVRSQREAVRKTHGILASVLTGSAGRWYDRPFRGMEVE